MTVPDNIEALARLWEARDQAEWANESERYAGFGKQAIKLGQPTLAFDILNEGMSVFPQSREMRYLSALALTKSGSTSYATRILRDLVSDLSVGEPLYPDALSLAGRIAKDRWYRLPEGDERQAAGKLACLQYQQAFEVSHDYFPGINAATMSALTGCDEDAQRLAHEVRALCMKSLEKSASGDYWCEATLGEANLLLNDEVAAIKWYERAAEHAAGCYGDIASMRRQMKLLARKFELAQNILRQLVMPQVVVFTGHMLDAPGRRTPRFPAQIERAVEMAIEQAIAENNIGFGYCSAACGADILFIERMLNRGAEINIVLPFQRDDFIRTSVAFAGPDWVARFDRVMAQATSVSYCVDEDYLGDDLMFTHAGLLIQGLAVLRAEQLETDAAMLSVVEPQAEAKAGGTAANLACWHERGRRSIILDLSHIRNQAEKLGNITARYSVFSPQKPIGAILEKNPISTPWDRRQIKTMLFADMVGYSKLREQETPGFFVHFLSAISREIDASEVKPAFGNTWGDGLYLVFDNVEDAADFALRLRDAVAQIDWGKAGLPEEMNIRIGMHTGPVFQALDPIIRHENFFGSHVTRAARIEPVAVPGSVYVSEQMAAVLAAAGTRRFACDYLGSLSLAKHYGSSRLYRLRRFWETE
ncbi:TRAFs-binding domain-containing protein [Pseudomonas sp.]|uniref:TRAFs-binding domain-containing protein n=1 Tax=Pseudomonas sp. TaxID=306 RepID=UPI002718D95C|nr:TRAFs-binding domain-containing protein [Pseudomonas sp.]MDO8707064.1 TRAFs-binding domain-containing protein [Pseudomonas sp.]